MAGKRKRKGARGTGAITYSLRSGRSTLLAQDQEVTSTNVSQPQANIADVTHVTETNVEDGSIANEQAVTNQETIISIGAENTPGGTVNQRKLLGKTLETKRLDDVYDELCIRRTSEPPLVPLCRLVPHEAIRTASSSLIGLKAAFDDAGYSVKGSPPFFVSLRRPGSLEYMRVTAMDKTLWGAVWTKISDDFDSSLPNEWQDLKGKKFLVWDGNHRLKAWMQAIRESFALYPAMHVSVKCFFLELEDKKEGELLLALKTTNEIVTTHITPTYAHDLFLFQKFGMCNKDSLLEQLSEEDKRWVAIELQAEQKIQHQSWYNAPANVLSLLVWKKEIKIAKRKAVEEIERPANMNDVQYEEEKKKAENGIERQYQMRAYKYLQVANPANGEGFFRLVWDYDWSPANRGGPLTKDKLLIIASSRLTVERKQEVLHDLIQVDKKAPKYMERFKDAPCLRRYLDREAYWRYLLEEAEIIVDELLANGTELPYGLTDFFYISREMHIDNAFSCVWSLIKSNSTRENSPELQFSARRLIYRWTTKLCKDMILNSMPQSIEGWSDPNCAQCMYSPRFWEKDLTLWERNACPWWLDYPLNTRHSSEEDLYAMFVHNEEEQIAQCEEEHEAQNEEDPSREPFRGPHHDAMSPRAPQGSATKRQADSLIAREHRTKKKFDFVAPTATEKRVLRSNDIQFCTHIEVMFADIINMGDNPSNGQIEDWLEKVDAKHLTHRGSPHKEVVNLVWADFPTGLAVAGACPRVCPSWNVWQRDISIAAAQFAESFVADEGWYITCGLTEHFPLVCAHTRKRGFMLHRTFLLLLDYGYFRDDGEEVLDLTIGCFYRKGFSVPPLRREEAESVNRNHFDKKRSVLMDPSSEEGREKTEVAGQIIRGGSERHPEFWRWLLLAFTEKHDSVIDIFCGVGGLGRESAALQRHCLCIDRDEELYTVLGDVPCTPSD